MRGGAVSVFSRPPQYEELVRDGELGPLFEPRDALTLAAQLERLLRDPGLVGHYSGEIRKRHAELEWSRGGHEYSELSGRIAARRHAPDGKTQVRHRLGTRDFVHVDLHMHT